MNWQTIAIIYAVAAACMALMGIHLNHRLYRLIKDRDRLKAWADYYLDTLDKVLMADDIEQGRKIYAEAFRDNVPELLHGKSREECLKKYQKIVGKFQEDGRLDKRELH